MGAAGQSTPQLIFRVSEGYRLTNASPSCTVTACPHMPNQLSVICIGQTNPVGSDGRSLQLAFCCKCSRRADSCVNMRSCCPQSTPIASSNSISLNGIQNHLESLPEKQSTTMICKRLHQGVLFTDPINTGRIRKIVPSMPPARPEAPEEKDAKRTQARPGWV